MDSMNCASYEQILIDDEMISMIKQLVTDPGSFQGDMNQDTIFNDIRQSLEDPMYFMSSDVTIKEFKNRLWNSSLIVRQNFDQWRANGMKSMADHALQKARDILDHYEVDQLEPAVLREMNEIVEKARTRSPS
ncbi:hypothetical protein DRN85_09420 [Methanosarcinales archaeon]|nr:MAG: hypothetical protein DRN85_09420 [Methanosarcinales archaeon]